MNNALLQGTCFSIPEGLQKSDYEAYCNNWIKPYLHIAYKFPDFKFFFYISGVMFEYLQKNMKECIDVLREMSDRNQLEILAGMYYDAAPVLQSRQDQKEQLEMLSHYVRTQNLDVVSSKGAWLMSGTYDHNIILSLSEQGMKYLIIDRAYLEPIPDLHEVGIVESLGTKLIVFPYEESTCEQIQDPAYVKHLIDILLAKTLNKLVILFTKYSPSINSKRYFNGFKNMLTIMKRHKVHEISKLPSDCITLDITNKKICRIRSSPYGIAEYSSFFYYLLSRFESRLLYSYFLYIMKQISVYKKQDKDRKQSARRALKNLQNHFGYWKYNEEWGIHNNYMRQHRYKALIRVEKSLKKNDVQNNKNTNLKISKTDYDLDGNEELLVSSQNMFIVLEEKYGSIICFLKKLRNWNYLSCYTPYENPKYFPALLKDYMMTIDTDVVDLHNRIQLNNSITSLVKYNTMSYNTSKVSAKFISTEKNPIQIEKSYSFTNNNSNLINIQYTVSYRGKKSEIKEDMDIQLILEMNFSFQSPRKEDVEIFIDDHIIATDTHVLKEGKVISCNNFQAKENMSVELQRACTMSIIPIHGAAQVESKNMYQHHSLLCAVPFHLSRNATETIAIQVGFSNISK